MALEQENKDLAQKVNDFLLANRKPVLIILVCILLAVLASITVYAVSAKMKQQAIADVERVIYDLEEFKTKYKAEDEKTDDKKADDSEKTAEVPEAIKAEEDKTIEKLLSFTAKRSTSYSAFRANTAIAEIYFQRKSYEDALKYYELAAHSVESAYTAGLAYFNAAACADELSNNEKALELYEKASAIKDFPLVPRALFNAGRVYEALGQTEKAVNTYNKLLETYPKNDWALLAKSRIIFLSKENE